MSDLFSRLAQQHLGQAPALQPALAPRFAPQVGAPVTAADLEVHEEVQPAGMAEAKRENAPHATGAIAAAPRIEQHPRATPQASHASSTASTDIEPRSASPSARANTASATPADTHGTRAAQVPAWPASPMPRAAAAPAQPAAVIAAGLPIAHAASTPQLRAAAPAPQALAAPLSHERAQALAPRGMDAAQGAPVVHVHIDRIDVRAPAAPPRGTPARATRPAPATSLSDYLRSGGRK